MTSRQRTRIAIVSAALVLASAAVAGSEPAPAVPKPEAPSAGSASASDAASHLVRVYYFRTTTRCASCKKIEAFADSAIKKAFAQEMEHGKLAWRVVNVQERGNEHFIPEYNLATKSVVVVDMVNGGQVRWKNLGRIWELLDDEATFARYVEEEVRQYLEGRS